MPSNEVLAGYLAHPEGRHRMNSGRPAILGGTIHQGASGWAAAACLLQPIVHDILVARSKGLIYDFTGDDLTACMTACLGRVPTAYKPPKTDAPNAVSNADASDDSDCDTLHTPDDSYGDTLDIHKTPGLRRMQWYNSVNAGWAVICWALLSGHATMSGGIGRGAFAVALLGQSPKAAKELASLGVRTAADFHGFCDALQRMSLMGQR